MATRRFGNSHEDTSRFVYSIGTQHEEANSLLTASDHQPADLHTSFSPGQHPADTFSALSSNRQRPEDSRSLLSPSGQKLSPAGPNKTDTVKHRLKTYINWNGKKSALQLAASGFIYSGTGDEVQCESCGIRLFNWKVSEDPLQAHKKYSPDCGFMLTNFPHIKSPRKPTQPLTVKYPHYSSYQSRLDSFEDWPVKCVAQKPEMMARSGFFYFGSADRARCFHCGVTLRDWDTDDYPPCSHKQWSQHCPFVQTLDVEAMTEEIEEFERMERCRKEYDNSTFSNCGSRESCTNGNVVADGNTVPRADNSQPLSPNDSQMLSSRADNSQLLSSSGANSLPLLSKGDNSKEYSPLTSKSPAFVALVEMGYPERHIYKAAEVRRNEGCLNPDATSLLSVILDIES